MEALLVIVFVFVVGVMLSNSRQKHQHIGHIVTLSGQVGMQINPSCYYLHTAEYGNVIVYSFMPPKSQVTGRLALDKHNVFVLIEEGYHRSPHQYYP